MFQPSKYFQRIRLAPYALSYQLTSPGSIATRWSTALGSNPLIIMTQDQTLAGRLHGIELTIQQSLSVCTGVQATTLPDALSAPSRTHYSRKSYFPARIATGCDRSFGRACRCCRCQWIVDRWQYGWLELYRAGACAVYGNY